MQELAKDPSHGNVVTPKGLHEAEVGLSSVEQGKIPGPIRRDPSGNAEFLDANNTPWDVKSFNSNFPPSKGGFELTRDLGKVQSEVDQGENVILDTTNLAPNHVDQLRSAITTQGLHNNVVWYP